MTLDRHYRTILFQLYSSHCSKLQSYFHFINAAPSPDCPDVPETVQHLFSCPHNPTDLTLLFLIQSNPCCFFLSILVFPHFLLCQYLSYSSCVISNTIYSNLGSAVHLYDRSQREGSSVNLYSDSHTRLQKEGSGVELYSDKYTRHQKEGSGVELYSGHTSTAIADRDWISHKDEVIWQQAFLTSVS